MAFPVYRTPVIFDTQTLEGLRRGTHRRRSTKIIPRKGTFIVLTLILSKVVANIQENRLIVFTPIKSLKNLSF